jgi:Glyoxalase-like domain
VEFDHVLYAVRDFEGAARRFRDEFGLAAVPGGRHEGWGTANWIVPLGPSYIELIGVENREEASRDFLGKHIIAVLEDGERWIGWCVRPDSFDDAVARLGLEVSEGSRVRPDGTTVRWRTAEPAVTMVDPSRPFFIEWLVPEALHPGRMPADHQVEPRGISWVEVQGDESAVRDWMGGDLPVRVQPGLPSMLAVGLATATGDVVLRS